MTDYYIEALTAAGVRTAIITDMLGLAYSKRVNEPGLCGFALKGGHSAISGLANNSQIIVYRKNDALGLDWTADFYGLYRAQRRATQKSEVFAATCPGILTMLSWRINAWYAGTASRSLFTTAAAETIMKTLVNYNCTSNASTANGRLRAGTITGISIEADGAAGNSIDRANAWKILLEELQYLAKIGGGDFNLVKTAAATWEFRWYTGQLGTDRTATVLFSLALGNMADPVYTYDRIDEKTVAIVAGQGEQAARVSAIRTGTDYDVSTNNIEMMVDARNETTAAGLNAAGDAKLEDSRAKETLDFKVLQIPSCAYGLHYGLGDLVTSRYVSNLTHKVVGVDVSFTGNGEESIDVKLETV